MWTIGSELKRLNSYRKENGRIPFECGCACGEVTELKRIPEHYDSDQRKWVSDQIEIWGNAGFDYIQGANPEPKLLFIITEDDLRHSIKKRKYYFNKEFHILEYYEERDIRC